MDGLIKKISSPENGINGETKMALLTWRDLSVLVKTNAKIEGVHLVPVIANGKKKYEIHLEVEGEHGMEKCILVTARDKPQAWTSLNKAIEELEKNTDCESFEIIRFREEQN